MYTQYRIENDKDIKVNSGKMVELIKKHLRMPMDFMISETIIHCESISIKEW